MYFSTYLGLGLRGRGSEWLDDNDISERYVPICRNIPTYRYVPVSHISIRSLERRWFQKAFSCNFEDEVLQVKKTQNSMSQKISLLYIILIFSRRNLTKVPPSRVVACVSENLTHKQQQYWRTRLFLLARRGLILASKNNLIGQQKRLLLCSKCAKSS